MAGGAFFAPSQDYTSAWRTLTSRDSGSYIAYMQRVSAPEESVS